MCSVLKYPELTARARANVFSSVLRPTRWNSAGGMLSPAGSSLARGSGFDTGDGFEPRDGPLMARDNRVQALGPRGAHPEHLHAGGVESRGHRLQPREAADQQTGADEKDDGER